MREVRIYIAGTNKKPAKRNRGGNKPTYKHFHPKDKLYYKKDGKYYCIVDDKSARGYIIRTEDGKEEFLPHDYKDIIAYEEARRLCRQEDIHLPRPGDQRFGKRVPPPLFIVQSPHRPRLVWNRSAILRHIDECKRRRNLVS